MTNTSGWLASVQSASTFTRPASVERCAGRVGEEPAEWRCLDAGGPDLRRRLDPAQRRLGGVRIEPVLVDMRDRRAQMDLDPNVSQVPHRPLSERLGKGAEDGRRSVKQHDPRLSRIDAPEVAAQCMARQLRKLPRELDAGRPCTDDDERQKAAPGIGVGLAFCHLERAQDPPT